MAKQTQDLEQIAREALGFVPASGVDGLPQRSKEGLQYGLEKGLFTQEQVDIAQVEFRKYKARQVLEVVETMGLGFVIYSQAHNPHLQYGLEHKLYDRSAVNDAQKKYEASHPKK